MDKDSCRVERAPGVNGCEAGRMASGGRRARHASRQRERFLSILFAAFPLAFPSLPYTSIFLLYQLALIAYFSLPSS